MNSFAILSSIKLYISMVSNRETEKETRRTWRFERMVWLKWKTAEKTKLTHETHFEALAHLLNITKKIEWGPEIGRELKHVKPLKAKKNYLTFHFKVFGVVNTVRLHSFLLHYLGSSINGIAFSINIWSFSGLWHWIPNIIRWTKFNIFLSLDEFISRIGQKIHVIGI